MSRIYWKFNRQGGGEFIIPESEIGLVSTLMTKSGTDEEPVWTQDETRSLIYVKSTNSNVVVDHSIAEIAAIIKAASKGKK